MPVQLGLPEIDPFAGGFVESDARFVNGNRIELRRRWAITGRTACVIGCNPSVASGVKDDPTTKWWINWFRENDFAEFKAVNLWPFATSQPAECRRMAAWEKNGPDWYARDQILFVNLPHLVEVAKAADQVFVCWGAVAWDDGFIDHVIEEIHSGVAPYPSLWCWGFNTDGSPKHPMARGRHRIPKGQKALMWRRGE